MADADEKNRRFWLARARREAARFNVGWWLQLFLPWLFAIGLGASALVLALRTAERPLSWVLPLVVAALVIGAAVAFLRSRARFLSLNDSLTRLDADLRFHNRLTVAREGITPWPAPRDDARLALRWQWSKLFWPPLAALSLALIAVYVPIPTAIDQPVKPYSQPPSWTAMEEKLDALAQTELVEEKAREEFREAVQALRDRPQEEWYSHESLEASDHLNAQLNENLAALEKNLTASLGALEASRQLEQGQFQALEQGLDQSLASAAQAMQDGQMPLDPKLLEQLKDMKGAKVRQLSAEEWKQLQQRMKEGVATASTDGKDGQGAAEAALAALGAGSGKGDKPGSGGVTRGAGEAPLTLADKESHAGSTKTEGMSNDDLSRAVMGDPSGLSQGRHEVDKSDTAATSGGAMSSTGQGAQATWQQTATPAEQAALQRFFK